MGITSQSQLHAFQTKQPTHCLPPAHAAWNSCRWVGHGGVASSSLERDKGGGCSRQQGGAWAVCGHFLMLVTCRTHFLICTRNLQKALSMQYLCLSVQF